MLPVIESAMSDAPLEHARTADYSFRVPTPPRITIPSPAYSTNRDQRFDLGRLISPPDPQSNIDFLQDSAFDAPLQGVPMEHDWKHNNRREAQSVLSFLYLGPAGAAKDRVFLRQEGITMVLGMQVKHKHGSIHLHGPINAAKELGIAYAVLEVGEAAELIPTFPKAVRLINTHVAQIHKLSRSSPNSAIPNKGKVLVFCESGNEKSAMVVAGYLISSFENVNHIQAMQVCHSRRFCCVFDDNMKQTLLTYHGIVQAQRMVSFGNGDLHHKRSRETGEDITDAAMDIDQAQDDAERFEGRHNVPFQDIDERLDSV